MIPSLNARLSVRSVLWNYRGLFGFVFIRVMKKKGDGPAGCTLGGELTGERGGSWWSLLKLSEKGKKRPAKEEPLKQRRRAVVFIISTGECGAV